VRILYITQYFAPEMGAPSVRVYQLARHWVGCGHEVTVLTGFPNHPTGRVYPGYRSRIWRFVSTEDMNGVKVVRTWLLPRPNRRAWDRILTATSFMASACVTGPLLPRFDVAIATSPQLLVGIAGWWRRLIRGTPLVFEVRDLWPESIVGVGLSSEGSFFVRGLAGLARLLYAKADRVVAVNEAIRLHLEQKERLTPEKLAVIPPGVDTAAFNPPEDRSVLRDRWNVEGRFVVAYVGTHGQAHDLKVVLDAAAALEPQTPDVLFMLVGEGADKRRLQRIVSDRNLTNVRFEAQQPLAQIPGILAASDVCLAHLRPSPVFETAVPTKLLEYMACRRPIISNVQGEAARLLNEAKAGQTIPPRDAEALAHAILSLRGDPPARDAMGRRGSEYVARHRSWSRLAEKYLNLLGQIEGTG